MIRGNATSARVRGRQSEAWGGAQRNPRSRALKIIQACEAGGSDETNSDYCARPRNQLTATNKFLGFRGAPPWATCCRLLRRLKTGRALPLHFLLLTLLTILLPLVFFPFASSQ